MLKNGSDPRSDPSALTRRFGGMTERAEIQELLEACYPLEIEMHLFKR